jgi:hypothetical protein
MKKKKKGGMLKEEATRSINGKDMMGGEARMQEDMTMKEVDEGGQGAMYSVAKKTQNRDLWRLGKGWD